MRRMSIKASKSVSQAGRKRTVTVRVSNGKTAIAHTASLKTK